MSTDSLLEAAGDAIIIVDATGTIRGWNRAATELLGHPSAHAVGQTLALIIPAERRARHIAGFRQAIKTRGLLHVGRPTKVRAHHADGTTLDLVMTLGITTDQDPRVIAILRPPAAPPIEFMGDQTPPIPPPED